jgi:hypothetical protein
MGKTHRKWEGVDRKASGQERRSWRGGDICIGKQRRGSKKCNFWAFGMAEGAENSVF